jgi:hypothetical protein
MIVVPTIFSGTHILMTLKKHIGVLIITTQSIESQTTDEDSHISTRLRGCRSIVADTLILT